MQALKRRRQYHSAAQNGGIDDTVYDPNNVLTITLKSSGGTQNICKRCKGHN